MKIRWVTNLLLCLTAIAVLASFSFQGNEAGSTPLSVPVDEEGFDKEVEKDLDDSTGFGLVLCRSCPAGCRPLICSMPCEGIPKIDVLHNRCFGTRGPPVVCL
jgi:hypothetical protein